MTNRPPLRGSKRNFNQKDRFSSQKWDLSVIKENPTQPNRGTKESDSNSSENNSSKNSYSVHWADFERSLVQNGVVRRNLIFFVSQLIMAAVLAILYAVQAFSEHTSCTSLTGRDMTEVVTNFFVLMFILHTLEFVNAAFFSPYFQIACLIKSALALAAGKNHGEASNCYKVMATISYVFEWLIRLSICVAASLQLLMLRKYEDKCITSDDLLAPEAKWLQILGIVQLCAVFLFAAWRESENPFELSVKEKERLSIQPSMGRKSLNPKYMIRPLPGARQSLDRFKFRKNRQGLASQLLSPADTMGSAKFGYFSVAGKGYAQGGTTRLQRESRHYIEQVKDKKLLSVGDRLTERQYFYQHGSGSESSEAEETESLMQDTVNHKIKKMRPNRDSSNIGGSNMRQNDSARMNLKMPPPVVNNVMSFAANIPEPQETSTESGHSSSDRTSSDQQEDGPPPGQFNRIPDRSTESEQNHEDHRDHMSFSKPSEGERMVKQTGWQTTFRAQMQQNNGTGPAKKSERQHYMPTQDSQDLNGSRMFEGLQQNNSFVSMGRLGLDNGRTAQ